MQYYETIRHHTNDYDSILMYPEIDENYYETKRLEIFLDGKTLFFDYRIPMELGEVSFPESFDEINQEE